MTDKTVAVVADSVALVRHIGEQLAEAGVVVDELLAYGSDA